VCWLHLDLESANFRAFLVNPSLPTGFLAEKWKHEFIYGVLVHWSLQERTLARLVGIADGHAANLVRILVDVGLLGVFKTVEVILPPPT
jgi:hypothetical protein